jgi:hypothetical protein
MVTSLEAIATKLMMGRGKVLNKKRHLLRDDEEEYEMKVAPRRTSSVVPAITHHPAVESNRNKFNPFELLDEKIHSYILSFLLNLRVGYCRPGRDARTIYVETRRRSLLANTDTSTTEAWKSDEELQCEFQYLSQSKQLEYHELSRLEKIQRQQEESMYTRPEHLNLACETTSLVSTKWRNVVGRHMNAQTPAELISPLDLFLLKRRVHSLDFSQVCTTFTSLLQQEYGGEPFPPREFDVTSGLLFETYQRNQETPLEVVVDYFAVYNSELEQIVATEYARFLVIQCIQVLASRQQNVNASTLPWTEPCEPCELVKLFWEAHLLFPKQYARDCKVLLDPLVVCENELDYILDYNGRYCSKNNYIGSDYQSKRHVIWEFEEQMQVSGKFFGRFGDAELPEMTHFLFENMFQVVKMAEAIRKEDEKLCQAEERRA